MMDHHGLGNRDGFLKSKNIFLAWAVIFSLGMGCTAEDGNAPATQASLNEIIPQEVRERIDRKRAEVRVEQQLVFATSSVDLRYRDTSVKHQFGGTCSAFGLIAAMENSMGGKTELSERHAWSRYRRYSSQTAVSTLSKLGVVEEQWWPQSSVNPKYGYSKEPKYKLGKSEYFEDDIQKGIEALEAGRALYFGVSTPKDMYNCQVKIRPTSGLTGGGHAFAVVGYQTDAAEPAGGYFLVKNSWGKNCGDGGYQWFPFSLCRRADMYCMIWAIDEVIRYQ